LAADFDYRSKPRQYISHALSQLPSKLKCIAIALLTHGRTAPGPLTTISLIHYFLACDLLDELRRYYIYNAQALSSAIASATRDSADRRALMMQHYSRWDAERVYECTH
jgi:hypothetical protein